MKSTKEIVNDLKQIRKKYSNQANVINGTVINTTNQIVKVIRKSGSKIETIILTEKEIKEINRQLHSKKLANFLFNFVVYGTITVLLVQAIKALINLI